MENAIEGRLGRIKKSMITEPAYALDAAKIFRRMQQFEEVDLINSGGGSKRILRKRTKTRYIKRYTQKADMLTGA